MEKQNLNPDASASQQIKITANRSEPSILSPSGNHPEGTADDFYTKALIWMNGAGQKFYGPRFRIHPQDHVIITKILCYFHRDEKLAEKFNINLNKGLLLSGPVGCGKSSLMFLARYFQPPENRFIIRPCREVGFEFIREGYDIILDIPLKLITFFRVKLTTPFEVIF